jgi:hypothetical protein
MTESTQPAYFGMDVDAELARYEREDRQRAKALRAPTAQGASKRSLLGQGLADRVALTGKEAFSPQPPLAA